MEEVKRTIPWTHFQGYQKLHNRTIDQLVDLKEQGKLKKCQVEEQLPEVFLEIKECVDDILERNHIIVGKDALIKQLK